MDMIKIELTRDSAATLLEVLERRLEAIQSVETFEDRVVALEMEKEKEAIVPAIMALERALKTSGRQ